jgi:hypothetical protein
VSLTYCLSDGSGSSGSTPALSQPLGDIRRPRASSPSLVSAAKRRRIWPVRATVKDTDEEDTEGDEEDAEEEDIEDKEDKVDEEDEEDEVDEDKDDEVDEVDADDEDGAGTEDESDADWGDDEMDEESDGWDADVEPDSDIEVDQFAASEETTSADQAVEDNSDVSADEDNSGMSDEEEDNSDVSADEDSDVSAEDDSDEEDEEEDDEEEDDEEEDDEFLAWVKTAGQTADNDTTHPLDADTHRFDTRLARVIAAMAQWRQAVGTLDAYADMPVDQRPLTKRWFSFLLDAASDNATTITQRVLDDATGPRRRPDPRQTGPRPTARRCRRPSVPSRHRPRHHASRRLLVDCDRVEQGGCGSQQGGLAARMKSYFQTIQRIRRGRGKDRITRHYRLAKRLDVKSEFFVLVVQGHALVPWTSRYMGWIRFFFFFCI